ncbi:MAG: carbonic anhydrase [Acidimicrobiaceae bacterium]|nr:carbonic anhydrase [Acidimicrobiaceae bacterium]
MIGKDARVPDTDQADHQPLELNLPRVQEANQSYASVSNRPVLSPRPAKRLCILTCMDARLDLFRALGLSPGDAHILRNAGGRASTDAIRSLVLSAHHLGTREFGVIHHTKCGLYQVSNQAIWDGVTDATGADASHIDFLPFDDLGASVRQDVDEIVGCGLLPADGVVWGATFDVDEGALTVVVPPTPLA